MIGKTISHYKILEKLGEGGMGVVYKAQDVKLKRVVTLKFLSTQTLGKEEEARFMNEAQVVAALDHPNICSIYAIDQFEGQTFMVMGYIEGQSLKQRISSGPLKLDEALDITIHVAEGLSEAHGKGIIHRDIKSGNIMLTPKGQTKIMDFGLAKLSELKSMSERGITMGTLAYMSPEQAKGEEVDHRTDIWSLGVVMYEMIAGRLPFKGEYEQAIIYSILNEEPERIKNLPKELEKILNKALAKALESRYQKIEDFLDDLKHLRKELSSVFKRESLQTSRSQPSIAVLPFTNLSADPEQEYFCDGMAEEMINALSHVKGLRVVARTSAFAFKGKSEDIREIGNKLNVETVLEGSVRRLGNQMRITAQLVSVADGYHLWSERFDRSVGALCCPEDVFAIQDEISLAIVENLKGTLLGEEKVKLTKRHTVNLDAYSLYLKGRYFWNKRTEESLKKSIQYFQGAIKSDADYALAYAGLADSYITIQDYSSIPPKEVMPKAKEAAERALEIDDTLSEAHTSLAQVLYRYSGDLEGAEREHKRSIELNPNYSTAHHWYAIYLMYMARFEEALEEIKRAWELDIFSMVINRNIAMVFFHARQYDRAFDAIQKALEMDPSFSKTHSTLGQIYLQKSMYREALDEFQKEKAISGVWDHEVQSLIGITYSRMGKKDQAREIVEELIKRTEKEYASPYYVARVYFALKEIDLGFKWLDKTYQEQDYRVLEIKVDPGFDEVRSDPRFKELLRKVGLEK